MSKPEKNKVDGYKEATPQVIGLLRQKIEEGKVSKTDYIVAAGICVLAKRQDLYAKLLELWSKPNDPGNLEIVKELEKNNLVKKEVEKKGESQPTQKTAQFTQQTLHVEEDDDDNKEHKLKAHQYVLDIADAIKQSQPVDHMAVIHAISSCALAGFVDEANTLSVYAPAGEEKKITSEIIDPLLSSIEKSLSLVSSGK